MSLKQRLQEEMKVALRAREEGRLRLDTLRLVLAAIRNAEIERRRELTDPEVVEVIAREVRQREEALAEFERGQRPDLVEKTRAEIAVLREYLPEPLSEAEIRDLARQAIAQVGATGPRDMGKVMQALMPKVKGRADGRLVSQVVRELLGEG
ncbi:MAG: GatB/YqeY domain-containing protein [Firmicutes bacterium]|nr:GatB/YqeY domain-containing protein [Bacillota bacterium]